MQKATLTGGPLGGRRIEIDDADQDAIVLPHEGVQLVYRRALTGDGAPVDAVDGDADEGGAEYVYAEEFRESTGDA